MPWPGSPIEGNVTEMPGMKISLDAAMRARDVSAPAAADETVAAQAGSASRSQAATPPSNLPGYSRRPRPRPGHGSAGRFPDAS